MEPRAHAGGILGRLAHPNIVQVLDCGFAEGHLYLVLEYVHGDFDKVAKLMRLGYPGGVRIEALATQGNPKAIDLPRPRIAAEPRQHAEHAVVRLALADGQRSSPLGGHGRHVIHRGSTRRSHSHHDRGNHGDDQQHERPRKHVQTGVHGHLPILSRIS